MLISRLEITDEERSEVGEILKADLREKTAIHPMFEQVNQRLQRMSKDNPRGE